MGKRIREPLRGDLVTHILMDDNWVGVVLRVETFKIGSEGVSDSKALVHINSDHSFSSQYREKKGSEVKTNKIGWVDTTFLKILSEGAEDEI
tara:strand:+ start:799 stop:1074 length:276 start_codon:yes stop_codon:yes gene_type:complete